MHNDDRGYLPVKTFAGVDYYYRGEGDGMPGQPEDPRRVGSLKAFFLFSVLSYTACTRLVRLRFSI